MYLRQHHHRLALVSVGLLLVFLAAAFISGCDDDDENPVEPNPGGFDGIVTEELAGQYITVTQLNFSGDGMVSGVGVCGSGSIQFTDTLNLCVGDTLSFGEDVDTSDVSCDFDGTDQDFSFTCQFSSPVDDTCTVDYSITGTGVISGETLTSMFTIVGTYTGANCSGTCTTTTSITQTRIGPAVCKRTAPARVPLFRLEEPGR